MFRRSGVGSSERTVWNRVARIAPMRVLHYSGLDISRVEAAFRRVVAALERDDFHAADVKKLVGPIHGKFYRAKLDDSNRLLFALASATSMRIKRSNRC